MYPDHGSVPIPSADEEDTEKAYEMKKNSQINVFFYHVKDLNDAATVGMSGESHNLTKES